MKAAQMVLAYVFVPKLPIARLLIDVLKEVLQQSLSIDQNEVIASLFSQFQESRS